MSSNPTSNKPAYYAYQVRESGPGKSFWTRVGVGWKNRDESVTVQLDSLPLDGRIVLQIPKADDAN